MLIDQLKSNSVQRFESHSHNSEQSQKDISQMKILVREKQSRLLRKPMQSLSRLSLRKRRDAQQ